MLAQASAVLLSLLVMEVQLEASAGLQYARNGLKESNPDWQLALARAQKEDSDNKYFLKSQYKRPHLFVGKRVLRPFFRNQNSLDGEEIQDRLRRDTTYNKEEQDPKHFVDKINEEMPIGSESFDGELGKRARKFVGKRKIFVGRRVPSYEEIDGKKFGRAKMKEKMKENLEKEEFGDDSRSFDGDDDDVKRSRKFVGKRLGTAEDFRTGSFLGFDGEEAGFADIQNNDDDKLVSKEENSEENDEKRRRKFVGKRIYDEEFVNTLHGKRRPKFVGKRLNGDKNLNDLESNNLNDLESSAAYLNSKRGHMFVGKRHEFESNVQENEELPASNMAGSGKRQRMFVGK